MAEWSGDAETVENDADDEDDNEDDDDEDDERQKGEAQKKKCNLSLISPPLLFQFIRLLYPYYLYHLSFHQ